MITTAADWAGSVYATDLDGDGDADVLSASRDGDKIAWYENLGGGAFGAQPVITTAADGANSVYATDLDGDGDADVLSTSYLDDKIAWCENLTPVDCNFNGVPDSCDLISSGIDCDGNGVVDTCELSSANDCDGNGLIDSCEIAQDPGLDATGDGLLDSCQCLVSNYCMASGNSSGPPSSTGHQGSLYLSSNDFVLTAASAPPFKFGVLFYSAAQTQIFLGEGLLCVGPTVQRLQPLVVTDQAGAASLQVDFSQAPFFTGPFAITPFSTWNFQFWYRDPQGGPAGFNFSDGLEVTFCP